MDPKARGPLPAQSEDNEACISKSQEEQKNDLNIQIQIIEQGQNEVIKQLPTKSSEFNNLKIDQQLNIMDQEQQCLLRQVPDENCFKKEILDKIISMSNKPMYDYAPKLNWQGNSKLAEYILQHGWYRPLEQINANPYKRVEWLTFEGNIRKYHYLLEGIYYGQVDEKGKRDGYGIVYTVDNDYGDQYLYECEWNQGTPINGRYLNTDGNWWQKYEGALDENYQLTGIGSFRSEDGSSFEGEWKAGERHGHGKLIYNDGSSYEGGWKAGCHGFGRVTEANGEYSEGSWKTGLRVGKHRYFTDEGKIRRIEKWVITEKWFQYDDICAKRVEIL